MKGSVFEGTLGFWVPSFTPPCTLPTPQPHPILKHRGPGQIFRKGCISSVCIHSESDEFFRIHVPTPWEPHQDCGGDGGGGCCGGGPCAQFRDSDLPGQTATSHPVTLDLHFSLVWCFPDKTTKQSAQNSPGEWKGCRPWLKARTK